MILEEDARRVHAGGHAVPQLSSCPHWCVADHIGQEALERKNGRSKKKAAKLTSMHNGVQAFGSAACTDRIYSTGRIAYDQVIWEHFLDAQVDGPPLVAIGISRHPADGSHGDRIEIAMAPADAIRFATDVLALAVRSFAQEDRR